MLISLWVFSITFAASATLILGARWVPASIMLLYNLSTQKAASGVDPLVTFMIFLIECLVSPGLILSGL